MKNIFKVLSVFVVAIMLSCLICASLTVGAADQMTLKAGSATAERGETVTVEITLENNPGFACLLITVPDVEGITLKEYKNGSIIRDIDHGANFLWSAATNSYSNGVLVTLTFEIDANAKAGAHSLDIIFRECYNDSREAVKVTTVSGTITVLGINEVETDDVIIDETSSEADVENTTEKIENNTEDKNNGCENTPTETEEATTSSEFKDAESDKVSTSADKDNGKSGGCGSAVSAGVVAITCAACAAFIYNRKRS